MVINNVEYCGKHVRDRIMPQDALNFYSEKRQPLTEIPIRTMEEKGHDATKWRMVHAYFEKAVRAAGPHSEYDLTYTVERLCKIAIAMSSVGLDSRRVLNKAAMQTQDILSRMESIDPNKKYEEKITEIKMAQMLDDYDRQYNSALVEMAITKARIGLFDWAFVDLGDIARKNFKDNARLGIAIAKARHGLFKEAFELMDQTDSNYGKKKAFLEIGIEQVKKGFVEEARETLRKLDGRELGELLWAIASAEAAAGDIDKSLKTIREISRRNNYARSKALANVAVESHKKGIDPTPYLRSTLGTAVKDSWVKLNPSALCNAAVVEALVGLDPSATFNKAVILAEKIGDEEDFCRIFRAQAKLGLDPSLVFYLAVVKAERNGYNLGGRLCKIASEGAKCGLFGDALALIDKVAERSEFQYSASIAYADVAVALADRGMFAEAEDVIKEINAKGKFTKAYIGLAIAKALTEDTRQP